MLFGVEAVIDGGVGGEEALGGALRFELLLFSFSSSDREMGVFRPIVLFQAARTMAVGKTDFPHGLGIRTKLVGDDGFGAHARVLQ